MRSENHRLQVRLRTSVSLETMKQALESKDNELTGAQQVAKEKTKAAEEKLASLRKLETENTSLKKEVLELKKQQAKQEGKLKAMGGKPQFLSILLSPFSIL